MICRVLPGLALILAAGIGQPILAQHAYDPPGLACQPGAHLDLPLTEAIRQRAILLPGTATLNPMIEMARYLPEPVTPETLAQIDEAMRSDEAGKIELLARLKDMPAAERDMMLLAVLDGTGLGDRPVTILVTGTDDRFLALFLEVLDRQMPSAYAAALRAGLACFPAGASANTRAQAFVDPQTFALNETVDACLSTTDAQYLRLKHKIILRAEDIAGADPTLHAALQSEATHIDEMTHLHWITGKVLDCAGDWYASVDSQDPFAALPQPQHDLAVLEIFMDEIMNGGAHQFFSNSSGGLAPEAHEALLRLDLHDQAAALKAGMDMLGDPYPRNRTQRSRAIDGFTMAQNDALNGAPTDAADDGQIYRAMLTLARSSGLMAAK